MVAFDNVYIAPRVRVALHTLLAQSYNRKFWNLLHKLRSGRFDIPGLHVEKLHTRRGKVYSARLNVDIRVIFSLLGDREAKSLVVWDVDHHDDAYRKIDRAVVPASFTEDSAHMESLQFEPEEELPSPTEMLLAAPPDDESLADGLILFKIPDAVLMEPEKFYAFEPQIDRYLRLTPQQEELLGKTDRAYLVQGSAGTGKTTLALFHALNLQQKQSDDVLLFTYQEELACVCRCYSVNLTGQESSQLRVYSYLEFCRHYLRKQIANVPTNWRWINRDTSIKHLSEIVAGRPRWARKLKAEDIYGYIYSILKGRFVPGTDQLAKSKDEFRRILKGYGNVPDNFEEILEIFAVYEQRLSSFNHKDEADLIRFCYDCLKSRAIVSEQQGPVWIVIDELQDFTELEWKSLLLFWENNCSLSQDNPGFPFLSGDRNQNISRSGFRWQEVDTYVERILRRIHRPSAFEKVVLHQNFRNTREIFQLGEFLRSFSSDAGAADDAPALIGRKPTLVIAEPGEFTQFLRGLQNERHQNIKTGYVEAPMVVLSEDEHYIRCMQAGQSGGLDSATFLMPLRAAKGMEFEDVLLYRLFSSLGGIENTSETALTARLYDLWYMAVTRARQNLMVVLTAADWARAEDLFADRFDEFAAHFQIIGKSDNVEQALQDFFLRREKYLPNYHVVFLQRTRAQQLWDDFRATKRSASRDVALALWQECRDWRNLGLAYQEIGEFAEALPYIRKTNLFAELGRCLEALDRHKEAGEAYEEDGAAEEAARCYALAREHGRAARIFEEHRQWLRAGECYAAANEAGDAARCFAQANEWEKAAIYYDQRENWSQAAIAYSQAGSHVQAANMFLRAGDELSAAHALMAAGEHLKAAEVFASLKNWRNAARCFELAQMFERAADLYERAGLPAESGQAHAQSGNWKAAALAYETARNWEKAAEAYLSAGESGRACDCLESGGDFHRALPLRLKEGQPRRIALCYERLGEWQQALESYLLVDAHNQAAYCLEKLERFEEAAEHYRQANNLPAAASMLARSGQRIEAARLYLLAGQKDLAIEVARGMPAMRSREKIPDLRSQLAEWAKTSGRYDLAASVHEDMSEHAKAAECYRSAMMFGKAAECFERARKFQAAGDLYAQIARYEEAAECFQRAKQWKKAAEYYELLKRWREARDMYALGKDSDGVARCESASEWF
jgi:tetratricopeptide (TPR) repeat protein